MSTARLLNRFLLLGSLLFLAACGADNAVRTTTPLFDSEHAPDVLTERPAVAFPPALDGNRFLSGWFPGRQNGVVALSPAGPEQRLEVVNLSGQPRRLFLALAAGSAAGTVEVRIAGQSLGSFAVANPIEVPLPGGLPLGRLPVDLHFAGGAPEVTAGALRPSLPSGEVRAQAERLSQAGDSLIEVVRPMGSSSHLRGSFVPPDHPAPQQRFSVTLDDGRGVPREVFSWTPQRWNWGRSRWRLDLPIPRTGSGSPAFLRVRLLARGSGPPAVWERLALAGDEIPGVSGRSATPTSTVFPATAKPPRLVLLYVMDALRADAVGIFGGPAGATPNLDRLARQGLAAYRHRSVAPNTLPSTKALFTGHPFLFRGGWKLDPADGATLAELFHQAGYRTGLFSGNVYVSDAYGMQRGFEHVAKEVLFEGAPTPAAMESPNRNAAHAQTAALAWLRSLPAGSKAFLYLHTIHPHNPYDPPEPQRSRWTAAIASTIDGSSATLTSIAHGRRPVTAEDRRRLRGLYQGSLAYNDAELAGFLQALAEWASPQETLLAFTADHGEEHFDHDGVLHGFTVYEEMLRIPLILWAPGRVSAGRLDQPTNTLDLHATLRLLCGLPALVPQPSSWKGRSLLALAANPGASPTPGEEVHFAAASSVKGGIYTAESGHWKLVWAPREGLGWGQGEGIGRSRDPEYLFDLAADPLERVNRAGHGGPEAAWLRSRLLAWIASHPTEAGSNEGAPVDDATLARLQALGYLR